MVVVSGATCQRPLATCDGCYNKSEKESNGKPVYINKHAKNLKIENDGKYWYIMVQNQEIYESMDIDGPQGYYESWYDYTIATVKCASVCPYTLK